MMAALEEALVIVNSSDTRAQSTSNLELKTQNLGLRTQFRVQSSKFQVDAKVDLAPSAPR
jgi:hypothetical protein